jgi:hypothetical protein
MYLDSPGFAVLEADETLRVVVPLDRVNRRTDFTADAVTAFMEVDASGDAPLLKVQNVYDILSGDLSLPLTVSEHNDAPSDTPLDPKGDAFDIADAAVQYISSLDVWVFSMQTQGTAASVVPDPHGALDGAPVLGYVFPVSLAPDAVGFGDIDGTLVLAVTSHPDFDDTPFWDETLDGDYANDGGKYHVHWAVLVADEDSAAGLTVPAAGDDATLPPTAPMPMYLDSPGFHAFASGSVLRVLVPAVRIDRQPSFNFDAVTARMQVDAGGDAAVLRVQEVFEVLSGDLSLPYTTETLASSDEL